MCARMSATLRAPTGGRRQRRARAVCLALLCVSSCPPMAWAQAGSAPPTWSIRARVVAVGLTGASGLRQVGRFHNGGPFTANPEFLLQTASGRVLDAERLLVATASNFGAPLASASDAPGSVLSIDPRNAKTLVVPPRFAAAGRQVAEAGGALQLYSAQSPAFSNAKHNGSARTADQAGTAGPRYLSINNAFGRVWIANAPRGIGGPGSVSVDDPEGEPLANAPSDDAGGVFFGSLTDRRQAPKGHASTVFAKFFNYRSSAQLTPGTLRSGALGTAFLGASPDGSGLAVFAVATADGAITQVHVQDGVDGLAPAGSVSRGNDDGGVIGMAFKWNPQRVLYVADAGRNRLLLLQLDDDRRQFKVARSSTIVSPLFKQPVDIAAALPEIANPGFASHTTLAGGSDIYVLNRGDGSVLRMTQAGVVLARAEIALPDGSAIGPDRLRALAVSSDARRLWLTAQGQAPGLAGHDGLLIEIEAFDAGGLFGGPSTTTLARTTARAASDSDGELIVRGQHAFAQVFAPDTGLGPLFNERSCVACHPGPGGSSARDEHFARRIAHMDVVTGRVTPVIHPNSPVARSHSTNELGQADAPLAVVPHDANISSLRMPPALFSSGAIDSISDAAIEAQAVSKGDGIKGRVHYVTGADGQQHVGRYGWKADIAFLDEMVADAFGNEIGIGSALAVHPPVNAKDDGRLVRAVSAYLRVLAAPAEPARP